MGLGTYTAHMASMAEEQRLKPCTEPLVDNPLLGFPALLVMAATCSQGRRHMLMHLDTFTVLEVFNTQVHPQSQATLWLHLPVTLKIAWSLAETRTWQLPLLL